MVGEHLYVPAADRYPCRPWYPDELARPCTAWLSWTIGAGSPTARSSVPSAGSDTTRLDLRIDAGRLQIIALPDGRHGLAGRDRVPLPTHLRRGCGIEPGDRVLLAAEPTDGVLTIHPLASLDAMLNATADPTPRRHAA